MRDIGDVRKGDRVRLLEDRRRDDAGGLIPEGTVGVVEEDITHTCPENEGNLLVRWFDDYSEWIWDDYVSLVDEEDGE